MSEYFYNLDTLLINNKTIIIDIDGTLVADGKEVVEEKNIEIINILLKSNNLFLCSNKNLSLRNRVISEQTNIPILDTPFKKPNKRIIDSIDISYQNDLVVIGDKYITDGIFARRIGADFIKIKRMRSKKESVATKIIYLFDDVAYIIVCSFNICHIKKMLLPIWKKYISFRVKSIEFLLLTIDYFTVYPKLRAYYKAMVKKYDPLIIDVGANKGQTINFFLNLFPKATIIAFEPNSKLYNKLTKKFKYLPNIHPINKGVSNQTNKLLFKETITDETSTFEELNYKSDYLKRKSKILGCDPKNIVVDTYKVDTIRLFDFINNENIQHINILKIDTEGHEFKCLEGLFCGYTPTIDIIQLEYHNDDMYLNAVSEESIVMFLQQNRFILHKKIKHSFGDFNELLFKNINS